MNDFWTLKGKPHKAQMAALVKCNRRKGFAYFMEMGLGKTAVCYSEFLDLRKAGHVSKMVVVCPASLKENWRAEFFKWSPEELKVSVWKQGKGEWDILITNVEAYSMGGMRVNAEVQRALESHRVYMVIDESTTIKNPTAKRTKNILRLIRQARVKRVLSGAPMVQGPQDMWAQFYAIGALDLNYYVYRAQYCRTAPAFKGRGVKCVGVTEYGERKLKDLMSVAAFRARKADWADLPEKIFYTYDVKLDKNSESYYRSLLRDFYSEVKDIDTGQMTAVEVKSVINRMMKLQQISSGFILNEDGVIKLKNNKLPVLKDTIEQNQNKIIVVSFYRYTTRMLWDELQEHSPAIITNQQDMKSLGLNITEQKRKFNEDDECKIIICQMGSAKYGHTLLGTRARPCDTVIHYESTYNLDDRIQIEDRNHRLGSMAKSIVHVDLAASKIERDILKSLKNKKFSASQIVDYIKKEMENE